MGSIFSGGLSFQAGDKLLFTDVDKTETNYHALTLWQLNGATAFQILGMHKLHTTTTGEGLSL